jgi:hypothetical protein
MFCTTFVLIFSFQGYPLYKAKQLQRKRREEGADLLAGGLGHNMAAIFEFKMATKLPL